MALIDVGGDTLFNEFLIQDLLENRRRAVRSRAMSISHDALFQTTEEDLISTVVGENRVDIPDLNRQSISMSVEEGEVAYADETGFAGHSYVDGMIFRVEITFTGDPHLFRAIPTNDKAFLPQGNVTTSAVFLIVSTDDVSHEIGSVVRGTVDEIGQNLTWLREDTHGFEYELSQIAGDVIRKRKRQLGAARESVANMGFVLRHQDELEFCEVPLERKSIDVEGPPTLGQRQLPDGEYGNILRIISNLTKVMERSPSAFENMKEEFIRDFYLVFLNGHYEGRATGETFNFKGKTDILVRENGENIFIAECKFWKGRVSYLKAIDQILRYLSWRDGKAALVILNRNKNSTAVCKQISAATPTHPQHKNSAPDEQKQTEFRYFFAREDDAESEIQLTVMVFDVPHVGKKHGGGRRSSRRRSNAVVVHGKV